MSALIVIPARYASTRFPGKPLAPLCGRPLIQHVYDNARGSKLAQEVVVATDDKRIFDAVRGFGAEAVMTDPEHASGTDRAAEVTRMPRYRAYDIIVNVQGDEPLISPGVIDASIRLLDDERAEIGTLARLISNGEDIGNPNVVKAVIGQEGFALYFSRAPVPYHRDGWKNLDAVGTSRGIGAYQHIGIYAYRKDTLLTLAGLSPSPLERIEKLEQLRALEHGMRIKVGLTDYESVGVDTPDDLRKVEKCLNSYS